MKALMKVFVLLLAVSSYSYASLIVECSSFDKMTPYIKENTLIVFDIDNTLIAPSQALGSDEWAHHVARGYMAEGLSKTEAIAKTQVIWTKVHERTEVRTIDEGAVCLIRELQESGFDTMALTARHPNDATLTFRELESVGISFNNSSFGSGTLHFNNSSKIISGILFSTLENCKGSSLTHFLSALNKRYDRIIFIDDKLSHVKEVEGACSQLGIDYVGLRFGGCDEKVKAFDPQVAQTQLHFMENILSDRQALNIMENG